MKKNITTLVMVFAAALAIISCKKDNPQIAGSETSKSNDKSGGVKLQGVTPSATPGTLYLILSEDNSIELTKSGSVFTSENYIPLQAGTNYSFNSAADGSGTRYFVDEVLSAYEYADDDKVSWDNPLLEATTPEEGTFQVARSQAYKFSVNFDNATLNWHYYNIKLFYYTDWDDRTEVLLDYKHPLSFEKIINLPIGNNMKFYSVNPDWYEWGAADGSSFNGSVVFGGGQDINIISSNEDYLVKITLDGDLQTGTYSFTDMATLPVTLISFNGKYTDKNVQLNWKTASEINVKGFEIQRTEDGKKYITLPVFTNGGKFSYSLTDTSVQSGKTYYYRIKTIDMDGSVQFSNVIAVKTAR